MGVDIFNTYLGLFVQLKVFITENGFLLGEEFFSLIGKPEYTKLILRKFLGIQVVKGCSQPDKEAV